MIFDLLHDAGGMFRWVLVGTLRGLWWLAWDFCVLTVGWSIGWIFLRIVTLGRLPEQHFGEMEITPWHVMIVVNLIGLVLLAMAIFGLTQVWPEF